MPQLTESERNEYAAMLVKNYPHRVEAFLKSLPLDQLQAVGNASEEEANENYDDYMRREIGRHGSN